MALFQATNVTVEAQPEGIAVLKLDVPGRSLNVFNREVLADLDAALDRVAADPSVKLLVLRSGKPGSFIAGADLHAFADIKSSQEATDLSEAGQRVFDKLEGLAVPTAAVIQGPCLGGGLECALACDYRLVQDHPKTQLGFPEIELG